VTFSTLHVLLTAIVVGVVSVPLAYRLMPKRSWVNIGTLAISAGIATFAWRLAANNAALNEDGFPGVSPNDLLAPVITYVVLGIHSSLYAETDRREFGRLRAALTTLALVVNVVTI
jgi:hypothetical protein